MTAEGLLYIKAFHIIFVVTWFAGLFYMVRLFVYFCEAQEKEEVERTILTNQYKIMMGRLWRIITVPSMILTVILGSSLFAYNSDFHTQPWMWAKLVFVLLLIAYHHVCGAIYKKFKKDIVNTTSNKMRLWNEGATLLLFAIVFLVELQDSMDALIGLGGFIGLSILLMFGIRIYKKYRKAKEPIETPDGEGLKNKQEP